MKVRLTSTLTCTLFQEPREGRVVVMRRRFMVVRLILLMIPLTKLSRCCETTMCRGFKSMSSMVAITDSYCSGRTNIFAPDGNSTLWPFLSNASLTSASLSQVRRVSLKARSVRSTSSTTIISGTRRLRKMALLKGPFTAMARASASCILAANAFSKSSAILPIIVDVPSEGAAVDVEAATDSLCSSSNRLQLIIACTRSDFSKRPKVFRAQKFLTRHFNFPTLVDNKSSWLASKCTCSLERIADSKLVRSTALSTIIPR
mmetsp:Transcript_80900/g.127382  ORF Transcript_80900/g.127382 Transcript_80900/m.127382 type:complete len:260 (+) Transcript_80900:294-1073(+)